jgi:flagellar FliL protein
MSKKKILIGLAILLIPAGYFGKGFLMPAAKAAPQKVAGTIYVLPAQFTINLQDGHYATMTVALVLAPGQSDGASATNSGASTSGSTAIGTLPEEALVRDIITNVVTNQNSATLISTAGRERIKQQILVAIKKSTDVKVDAVLFPDVAVQ